MTCPHCAHTGHRDLAAAATTIATRTPGGANTTPAHPGRGWSRTVEPDDTSPAPARPGVTPAADHSGRRHPGPLAG